MDDNGDILDGVIEAVRISTALGSPADRVWQRAVTVAGMNDELRPWLRMTTPRDLGDWTVADVAPGDR